MTDTKTAPHRPWTPRKSLVVAAYQHAKNNYLDAHTAIEEMVQKWKQAQVHSAAVNYYINLSDKGLSRLVNEVSRWLKYS